MGDNISRQGLLLQIEKDADGSPGWYGDTWQFIKTIKSMPSTDEWIPCSERLPEKGQLCICSDGNSVTIDRYKGEEPPYKWAIYLGDYEAWMPLPEPYKKSNEKPCTVASANVESYGESY